jgi:hypothetical protein
LTLNDSIRDHATGDYEVTRFAADSYDSDGVLVPGGTSTFTLTDASVQPMTGRDLKNLPEAQHGEETKVIYSDVELRPRTPSGRGDQIAIDGSTYEVIRSNKWDHWGETHWVANAVRIDLP